MATESRNNLLLLTNIGIFCLYLLVGLIVFSLA